MLGGARAPFHRSCCICRCSCMFCCCCRDAPVAVMPCERRLIFVHLHGHASCYVVCCVLFFVKVKTVEDREREYAEARARIFGTKSPPPQLPQPPLSSSASNSAAATTLAAGASAAATGEATAEAGSSSSPPKDTPSKQNGSPVAAVNGKVASADAKSSVSTSGTTSMASAAAASAGGGAAKTTTPLATAEGDRTAPAKAGSTSDSPAGKTGGSEQKAEVATAASAGRRAEREAKQAGGAITSQGPDGTPGFGSGRGKPFPGRGDGGRGAGGGRPRVQSVDGADGGNGSTSGDFRRSDSAGRGGGGGRGPGGRGNRRAPVNAGEWKGQRGMQRNRMAEKSDPDFVRNYDNYRPSFAPYRPLADPNGGGFVGVQGQGPLQQHPHPPRLLHQHQVGC